MILRGEFLTAYTPYQAEASQGSLQAFFEFQTQIARLTGLDLANASLYEGATATAEGVLLAINHTAKPRILIAGTLHPDYRKVIATYTDDLPCEIVEIEPGPDGRISVDAVRAAADDQAACLVVQSPNVYGIIEDWASLFGAVKEASSTGKAPLAIAVFNPTSLGLLKTPGDCGADVAVGEGQPLGTPLQLGGPYLGLFACKKDYLRRMPGRLVGETTDASGRTAYCLTLQTREQHIRGAKATSNICTNQGLFALRATMYMSAMGSRACATSPASASTRPTTWPTRSTPSTATSSSHPGQRVLPRVRRPLPAPRGRPSSTTAPRKASSPASPSTSRASARSVQPTSCSSR